jgi:hypothetical protein
MDLTISLPPSASRHIADGVHLSDLLLRGSVDEASLFPVTGASEKPTIIIENIDY